MKYYRKPQKYWEYPLFILGFLLFWLLLPVWLICSLFWWKDDAAFALIHIQALFYNPWELWGNNF